MVPWRGLVFDAAFTKKINLRVKHRPHPNCKKNVEVFEMAPLAKCEANRGPIGALRRTKGSHDILMMMVVDEQIIMIIKGCGAGNCNL